MRETRLRLWWLPLLAVAMLVSACGETPFNQAGPTVGGASPTAAGLALTGPVCPTVQAPEKLGANAQGTGHALLFFTTHANERDIEVYIERLSGNHDATTQLPVPGAPRPTKESWTQPVVLVGDVSKPQDAYTDFYDNGGGQYFFRARVRVPEGCANAATAGEWSAAFRFSMSGEADRPDDPPKHAYTHYND